MTLMLYESRHFFFKSNLLQKIRKVISSGSISFSSDFKTCCVLSYVYVYIYASRSFMSAKELFFITFVIICAEIYKISLVFFKIF